MFLVDALKVDYPLVMTNIAIENGPVEIVSFPINSMVDLSIVFCKRLPEGFFYSSLCVFPQNHPWFPCVFRLHRAWQDLLVVQCAGDQTWLGTSPLNWHTLW